MTFYIVRHGQTDWNLQKRIQGHTDIPLNDTGRAEAALLARELESTSFSACYSSDLSRAHETALILTQNQSQYLTVNKDLRLRERHFGSWEGQVFTEFRSASLEEKGKAESPAAVQERIFHFLHEIMEQQLKQSNVLVVTHGGIIKNLLLNILGLDTMHDISIENTGVLTLNYSNSKWSVQDLKGIQLLTESLTKA